MPTHEATPLVPRAAIAAARGGRELVDEARACAIIGGPDTPIHRSTFWRGIRDRRYPKPLKISARKNRWYLDELLAVHERAAADRVTAA